MNAIKSLFRIFYYWFITKLSQDEARKQKFEKLILLTFFFLENAGNRAHLQLPKVTIQILKKKFFKLLYYCLKKH